MRIHLRITMFVLVLGGALLALVADARAQGEPKRGFEAFRLVQTRNIFDPNRRALRTDESRRAESRSRADSFTLTGTMVTEGKTLAFFSGSRSDFNRVIPVGESVGDFKVKAIAPAQVELEREGKPTILALGRTLQLERAPGTEGAAGPEPADTPPADGPSPAPDALPPSAPSGYNGSRDRGDRGNRGDRTERTDRGDRNYRGSSSAAPPAPTAPGGAAPAGDKAEVLRRMMERRQQEMSK